MLRAFSQSAADMTALFKKGRDVRDPALVAALANEGVRRLQERIDTLKGVITDLGFGDSNE